MGRRRRAGEPEGSRQPPEPVVPAGSFMRRLSGGTRGIPAFSVLEEIYAPNLRQARELLQEQDRVGEPAPAPADPPDLPPPAEPGGRSRFGGRVVIRRSR